MKKHMPKASADHSSKDKEKTSEGERTSSPKLEEEVWPVNKGEKEWEAQHPKGKEFTLDKDKKKPDGDWLNWA